MSLSIEIGAYGWCHQHWKKTFYPDDLPVSASDDWRLSYYSNEFNAVLIPAAYLCQVPLPDCEQWVDDVHDAFRFIVECNEVMFDKLSFDILSEQLMLLQPQLSGLVSANIDGVIDDRLISFADGIGVDTYEAASLEGEVLKRSWTLKNYPSGLAYVEHDLADLRDARKVVEGIIDKHRSIGNTELTLIFDHQNLNADSLNKFRSVLDMMGF